MREWPYPVAVGALFVVIMLRANATYWLGRAARRGANRTRLSRLITSPGFRRAERLIARWGAPIVTLSFLTIGIQTGINLAAGATRMPLRRYLPAMTIGGICWAFLYATFGFVTVTAWLRLYALSPAAAIVVLVVLLVSLATFITYQVRHRDKENLDDSHQLAARR